MTNPELGISTSVSSLLLRIQRVELNVTFHNKLDFMEHFVVAIWLLEPKANYVFVASHFTYKWARYLYIITYICEQQT